ncbi:heavy metal translocating P-type ATPase [Paraglaciecola sp. 2405UD69-4]|uniref:heavy metal translocating P-type ATPase n=1 Tax=Paraglaciecola sp. 2405UD69-4 TaxID=3391836 RepID=UPI0039C90B99
MEIKCFHCGLDVPVGTNFKTKVMKQSQQFCCPGCLAVAESIVENGLEDYYHYRSEFAEKATDDNQDILDKLSVFDDDLILSEFVGKNNTTHDIQLTISGINCAACGWLIEKQLSKLQGIVQVAVNVSARRATVSWNSEVLQLSSILKHIENIGYHGKPFQPEEHEASYKQENQAFLKKLGLSGLMTMQVMMLNIGVFFDLFGHIDEQTKQYFNWVSLLLSTPVLLYSASGFYSGAIRAIKAKSVNMDVPVSIALSLTYLTSVMATFQNNGQTYFESLCMFVFLLLISRYLEHGARYKASQLSANMLEYMPTMANLVEGNQVQPVLAKSLKLQQSVLVKAGELVPVDGVIIDGQGQLDEAMLTGEFELISKSVGEPVYAGTVNQLGTLTIKVTSVLKHSVLNQINELQNQALANKPKIAGLADRFSQYFVAIVLFISAVTYLVWYQINPEEALWHMIAVLIATCPCALGLATPSALSCAVAHLNSKGILLKRGDALEQVSKVDWVAFDKTGTLTEGKFSLVACVNNTDRPDEYWLQIAACLEQYSEHPIAAAFEGIKRPYSVDGFSATIGKGVIGTINNLEYKLGSEVFMAQEIPDSMDSCNVFLKANNQVVCGFVLADKIRPSTSSALASFKDKTITLISGDAEQMVSTVAKKLDIANWLSKHSPEQKLAVIKDAQQLGHTVLMVGDGINDAPVLAQADVSVTLGVSSDLAKSSADIVLLDNSLDKIAVVFSIANRCKNKIKQNIGWAIGYNILVLPLAVSGILTPWMAVIGMSLSSLIVVINSIRLLK